MMISDKKTFTYKDGEFCGTMLENIAYTSIKGELAVNPNDMRPSKKKFLDDWFKSASDTFQADDTKKVFNASKTCSPLNLEVYKKLLYNTYNQSFNWNYQKLVEKGVRISLTVGNWDIMCNDLITRVWLKDMPYFKDGMFDRKEWVKTEFGKMKSWDMVDYEIVEDSGHLIGLDQPRVSYVKLKRLAEIIRSSRNGGVYPTFGNLGGLLTVFNFIAWLIFFVLLVSFFFTCY